MYVSVGEAVAFDAFAHELFDSGEKGRQCFAGSRGRGDQDVALRLNGGPRQLLRGSGRVEGAAEPIGDGGMEGRQYGHASVSRGSGARGR